MGSLVNFVNGEGLLWSVAMVGISAASLLLAWQVNVAVAAVFWIILTLALIAVRP